MNAFKCLPWVPEPQNFYFFIFIIFGSGTQGIKCLIAKKENNGIFFLLFSLNFAGFGGRLSAENLPFRGEGMTD